MTVHLPLCFDAGMIHIYYLFYSSYTNLNITEKARLREMDPEEGQN